MKKTILLPLSAILFTTFIYSQTPVPPGNVSGIWNLAGSPYQVLGSIQIINGQTLTIDPGVTVEFQGHYKFLVLGRLIAIGNATDSVRFTASNTTTGWYGLRFDLTSSANDTSKLKYCSIRWGRATGSGFDGYGGGVFVRGFSKIIFSNCLVKDNFANTLGAGLYLNSTTAAFTNNLIAFNQVTASGWGGGIGCHSGGAPFIEGNIISNNNAMYGGGINCYGADPVIINNTITNNSATNGGGIASQNLSSTPVIINNTIANNAAQRGGGMYCDQSFNPTVRNTIFWGNTMSLSGSQVYLNDDASDPNFYYCVMAGGAAAFGLNGNFYSGTYQNNISLDPLFVSPSGGSGTGFNGVTANWTLQSGSPCVDAGDPNNSGYPPKDKAGNPRVTICRIDMGAFEYQNGIPLAVSVSQTQQILCYGNTTAQAQATGTGGIAPYTYVWNNGQSAQTATGLGSGIYTVTVTMTGGPGACTATNTITISEPAQLNHGYSYKTPLDCFGGNDGNASITSTTGGTLPYTYSWSTGATTTSVTGLVAGTYSLGIRDANNCSVSSTFTVSNPPVISYSVATANVSCNGGNNGSITVNASGGTGTLQYSNDNGMSYQFSNAFSGLSAGTFIVGVKDANNCISSSQTVTITQPTAITYSVTQTNVSCNGGNNGSITITASGGTGTLQYTANASSQSSNIFSGLTSGAYVISVQDANGCVSSSQTVTISQPPALALPTSQTNVSCNGGNNGSASANPTGGVMPYTYQWATTATTQSITGLAMGNYTVMVTDANGCTVTGNVNITQPAVLASSTSVLASATCMNNDGAADVTPTGGTAPYTYAWSNGGTNQSIAGVGTGTYSVTITDSKGCTAANSIIVGTSTTAPTPNICAVSVDSLSNYNMVFWDKTPFSHVDSFIIYREITTNNYQPIGAVPYDSISLFIDTVQAKYFPNTGDPNSGTYRYKIQILDSCGNYSALSPYHNTVYLINNSGSFSWPQLYTIEGSPNPVTSYDLLRDDISNGNWAVIGSVSGTQQTTTDPNYASYPNGSWLVETQWGITCTATLKDPNTMATNLNSSKSNVYKTSVVSVNGLETVPGISVYPNPSPGVFTLSGIHYPAYGIKIRNVLGEVIYKTPVVNHGPSVSIDLNVQPNGIFFYRIETPDGTVASGKLIIQQ